jgi:hypothetical protein
MEILSIRKWERVPEWNDRLFEPLLPITSRRAQLFSYLMSTSPDEKQAQSNIDKTIPKADQDPYNFTQSQAATTLYSSSMAKPSEYDTESRLTTYTYTSNTDAQKFLKKVDNRVRYMASVYACI